MDYHEIVTKLIGGINPVGESNADEQRFENLKALIQLVDLLLADIGDVSEYKDCPEYSKSRAGKFALKYLQQVSIELRDNFNNIE